MAAPSSARYWELISRAQSTGLTRRAAEAYAALSWWGEHYDIPAPRIVSGKRDPAKQAAMRARWDRGDRSGLVTRPALRSTHTTGTGWDVADNGFLWVYGHWAPLVGARWGGSFRDPDPVHFDLGAL